MAHTNENINSDKNLDVVQELDSKDLQDVSGGRMSHIRFTKTETQIGTKRLGDSESDEV